MFHIRLLSVYLGASALVHKLESALSHVIARLHASCIELAVCLFTVGRDGPVETEVAKVYSMHKTVAKVHTFIIDVYHLAGVQGVLMHFQAFTQLHLPL